MPDPLPHAESPVRTGGAPLDRATRALVLLHGRGADAEGMLDLADVLVEGTDDGSGEAWAVLAPQADGGAWYPYRFLEPTFENQPWLDGALAKVGRCMATLAEAGIGTEQVVLGGFSQGACLAAEWAVRHATRFGGLLVFSGGVIGPPGTSWEGFDGDFAGTPALLAVHDNDPHIPLVRVEETARVLSGKGAQVDARLYRGTAHTITADAVRAAQALLAEVA